MQTVVVADGAGGRLSPLTDTRPRATLPVGDRPLLAHVLDAAAEAGATRFVVLSGDRPECVEAAIGPEHAGVPVEYVRRTEGPGRDGSVGDPPGGDPAIGDPGGGETDSGDPGNGDPARRDPGSGNPAFGDPAGRAPASTAPLVTAADRLDEAPFAVLDGGSLFDSRSVGDLYRTGPAVAVVGESADPSEGQAPGRAVLRTTPNGGTVTGVERASEPDAGPAPAGGYSFPAEAVPAVRSGKTPEGGLAGLLAGTTRSTEVRPVELDRHLAVRRPWDLLAATEWKLGDVPGGPVAAGSVSPAATLSGTVIVEDGARILPGSVLEGPVLVRSGATVGPNAYVRGATLVGPEARVGHAVEVENSVLMAGAAVGHLSYVGHSVLGRDANLGACTVTATRRHDGRAVAAAVDGERVPTGRTNFGAVVGDGAKTGITTGLNAGVTLSTGARTGVDETVLTER